MRSCVLGVVLGLGAVCGPAQAAYSVAAGVNFPVEGEVWRVAIGDVTGDGRKDVIALGSLNGVSKLRVYAQKEDGTLTDPPWIYALPDNSVSLALGDLDRDGQLDVVVGGNRMLTTFVSRPHPAPPLVMWMWSTDLVSFRIAVANFDRTDNQPDVVTVNGAVNPVTSPYVFRGNGQGGFLAGPKSVSGATPLEAGPGVEVADADGDGTQDLLIEHVDGTARLIYNSQPRGFAAPVAIDPGFLVEEGIFGDFNNDGRQDLVLAGAVTGPTFLYVYPQAASGERFPQATSLPSANGLALDALLGDDLDGDGRTDLLVAHRNQLGVYMQGDTGLGNEVLQPVSVSEITAIAAGDVNGDGCKDVVAAGYYNDVNVFYGSGCVGTGESVPKPDLILALSAHAAAAVVRLSTMAANASIQEPLVEIRYAVDGGTLQLGALPANCSDRSQTKRQGLVECLVDTMAGFGTSTLTLPLAVTPDGARAARVQLSARALTDTPEQTLANNAATTRFSIAPAPLTAPTLAPNAVPSGAAFPRGARKVSQRPATTGLRASGTLQRNER